jgi:hypothetical protein
VERDLRSKKELEDVLNQMRLEIERVEANTRDMEFKFREEEARLKKIIEENQRQIRDLSRDRGGFCVVQ